MNEFIAIELSPSNVDWLTFAFYVGVAMFMKFIVRFAGPISIDEYLLEEQYLNDDDGKINVIYRIFSPVIWSNLALLCASVILAATNASELQMRWLPVAFYWIILFREKAIHNSWGISKPAFFIEAIVSISTGILFDWCVVYRIPEYGVSAFDQSAIGFQMMIMACYAVVQFVVTSTQRKKNRLRRLSTSMKAASGEMEDGECRTSNNYHSLVDTSEKRLFCYEREYGGLLPKRYSDDLLLRAIFFSIMAIEDSNRPSGMRAVERILCIFGQAQTTGIMQQKSTEPLSDSESVHLAAKYVEQMWDRYLTEYARFSTGSGSPDLFSFGEGWYRYEYSSLSQALEHSFSSLYGDYCGTRELRANGIFQDVLSFLERNRYNLAPRAVSSAAHLFQREVSWFDTETLYWENEMTICSSTYNRPSQASFHTISSSNMTYQSVNEASRVLRGIGARVAKVTFIESAVCEIAFYIDDDSRDVSSLLSPEWNAD